MFSCHSCFLKHLQLEISSILCYMTYCGKSSVPTLRGSGFSLLTVWSLTCLDWRGESLSPISLCTPDTWSSAFWSGVFYFILNLFPWSLVPIGYHFNTRYYDSAFFFFLGTHSTFLASRITHYLSVFDTYSKTCNWSPGSLFPKLNGYLEDRYT